MPQRGIRALGKLVLPCPAPQLGHFLLEHCAGPPGVPMPCGSAPLGLCMCCTRLSALLLAWLVSACSPLHPEPSHARGASLTPVAGADFSFWSPPRSLMRTGLSSCASRVRSNPLLPWLFLSVSSQAFTAPERRSVSWSIWQRSELSTSCAVLSDVNLGGPRIEPSPLKKPALHVGVKRRSLPPSLKR